MLVIELSNKIIQFNIEKLDDNMIKVVAEGDMSLDNLTDEELISIILSVMGAITTRTLDPLHKNIDTNSDEYYEIMEEMILNRNNIIKGIINMINQVYARKTDTTLAVSEFSLAIYDKMLDLKNKLTFNKLIDTTHSDDVGGIEPLQGAQGFVFDTILLLLQSGKSKEEVKKMIFDWLDLFKPAVNELVENYTEEDYDM